MTDEQEKWKSPTGHAIASDVTDKLTKKPENVSCWNVSNMGDIQTDELLLCREAFEKWYTNNKPGCPSVAKSDGKYVLMQAHAAWLSWQAAWNTRADKAAPVERILPRDGHGDIIDQDQFYDHCNKCTDTMSDIEVLRERLKIEGDIAEKMFNALNDILHSAFEHGNKNLSGKTLDPDGELLFAGKEATRAYLALQGGNNQIDNKTGNE